MITLLNFHTMGVLLASAALSYSPLFIGNLCYCCPLQHLTQECKVLLGELWVSVLHTECFLFRCHAGSIEQPSQLLCANMVLVLQM